MSTRSELTAIKDLDDIYALGILVTANTGFANEENIKYLHTEQINGDISDNLFRSRNPKFEHNTNTNRLALYSNIHSLNLALKFRIKIQWTFRLLNSPALHGMSINHRGSHITMPHQLLNSTNIIIRLQ